jgi:hypothetical protein
MYSLWYDSDYDDREYTIVARRCGSDSEEQERLKIDYIWTNRLPASIWADAVNSPSNHRLLRGLVEHWIWR